MTHVNRRPFLKAARRQPGNSGATSGGESRQIRAVVGKDRNPELAATFKLKERGF